MKKASQKKKKRRGHARSLEGVNSDSKYRSMSIPVKSLIGNPPSVATTATQSVQ